MKKLIAIFASLFLLASLGLVSTIEAAISPIGLSLMPPLQFPPEDVGITGLRANLLYGKHRAVYGIDVGLIGNVTNLNFGGVLAVGGLFNLNRGETSVLGAQIAGLTNINVNKARIIGLQASLGVNSNVAESTVVGFQVAGLANVAKYTKVIGAQLGIYNNARTVYGLQIGIVNVAESLHGLQIGLINIHRLGLFAVCPGINFGF